VPAVKLNTRLLILAGEINASSTSLSLARHTGVFLITNPLQIAYLGNFVGLLFITFTARDYVIGKYFMCTVSRVVSTSAVARRVVYTRITFLLETISNTSAIYKNSLFIPRRSALPFRSSIIFVLINSESDN
jgi:hypothetical protein